MHESSLHARLAWPHTQHPCEGCLGTIRLRMPRRNTGQTCGLVWRAGHGQNVWREAPAGLPEERESCFVLHMLSALCTAAVGVLTGNGAMSVVAATHAGGQVEAGRRGGDCLRRCGSRSQAGGVGEAAWQQQRPGAWKLVYAGDATDSVLMCNTLVYASASAHALLTDCSADRSDSRRERRHDTHAGAGHPRQDRGQVRWPLVPEVSWCHVRGSIDSLDEAAKLRVQHVSSLVLALCRYAALVDNGILLKLVRQDAEAAVTCFHVCVIKSESGRLDRCSGLPPA